MASAITRAVRAAVAHRAEGRCEYCHIHQDDAGFSHHVDHIVSQKHGGGSGLSNLAWSCVLCNRYKGSDLASLAPADGTLVRLFHPRKDIWAEHFRVHSDRIEPLTPVGDVTQRLLQFNAKERIEERRLLRKVKRSSHG